MNLLEYYNEETKTLTLPYDYNEELKDLPNNVENIIFSKNKEYGKY